MLPEPQLTGHLDGFCLRYGDGEVAVFPTFLGAAAGLRAARVAMFLLHKTLNERRAV